jgi:hypothetical protein
MITAARQGKIQFGGMIMKKPLVLTKSCSQCDEVRYIFIMIMFYFCTSFHIIR